MKCVPTRVGVAGVAGLLIALAALGPGAAQQTNEKQPPPKEGRKAEAADRSGVADGADAERAKDERGIRESAERFVKAFNAGDAKAAAAQFLPKAEYVNSDGEAFAGREAIEKDLAEFFKEFPKARIQLEIDSIRFVGPRVAIEEGWTTVTHSPGAAPVHQSYLSVDLQVDGEWQLASVRETAQEEPPTPRDHLAALEWMVGEWVDESDTGVAHTSCRWSDDGNYLLQDFELKVSGRRAVAGQQRIGWDPLGGRIRSWVFDSQGGYSEGFWVPEGDGWLVKAQGVRPDGSVSSATNRFVPRGRDSYRFLSTDRTVGDSVEDDVDVIVVRRPPAPGVKPAEKSAAGKAGAAKPSGK